MYDKKISTPDELKIYYEDFNLYPNKTQIGLIFCSGGSDYL